jgi:transcriptional regulator with XRE-family HTH domain
MATDIGTRIKRARERKRWSQQRLADALQVDRKTIDNWENGRTKPRSSVGALEEVLSVRLDAEPQQPAVPRDVLEAIRREVAPVDQQRVIDAVERSLRGEPQPPPTSPGAAEPDRRQAG